MKRPKARTFGTRDGSEDGEDTYFKKKTEPQKTYEEHIDGKADDAFAVYSMTAKYAKNDLIIHPKFGKGVVVAVDLLRVEVLFAEGVTKKLGHAAPPG